MRGNKMGTIEMLPLEQQDKDLSFVENRYSFVISEMSVTKETGKTTIHTSQYRKLKRSKKTVDVAHFNDKPVYYTAKVKVVPSPKILWQPAKQGTVDEFVGALAKAFPELANVTEEDVKEALRSSRNKDFE